MKKTFVVAAAALLAGCAYENHRVEKRNGVTHYGLNDQPQKTVTGEGGLMRGETETVQIPTGQFTGQERTMDQIGQYPTPPAESDPRELNNRKDVVGGGPSRPE